MSKIPTYTLEQYHEFARSIEDGSYFTNARKWYSAIYLSVMPQRSFYAVLMGIALVACITALTALGHLLPLAPATPILFPMKDVARDYPQIQRLRFDMEENVNVSLQKYFASSYVEKREGYSFERIQPSFRFLSRYSTPSVMANYRKYIDPNTPQSPISRYGRNSDRRIEVRGVSIRRIDGKEEDWETEGRFVADVKFTAYVINANEVGASHWKSQLEFEYVPLKTTQPEDTENGKLKVAPMTFTVTDYTVIETLSETRG